MRQASDAGATIYLMAIEGADPVKTGFLRDHEVRTTKVSNNDGTLVTKIGPQAKVGYFTLSKPIGGKTQTQSAHYPSLYASWYEFGTKHQPARPVMGPAAETNKDRVVSAFIHELNEQLGKFA